MNQSSAVLFFYFIFLTIYLLHPERIFSIGVQFECCVCDHLDVNKSGCQLLSVRLYHHTQVRSMAVFLCWTYCQRFRESQLLALRESL